MRKAAAATITTQVQNLRLIDKGRHVNTEYTVQLEQAGISWEAPFCGTLVDLRLEDGNAGGAWMSLAITDAIEWDAATGPVPEGALGVGGVEYIGTEEILVLLDDVVEVLL